MASAHELAAPSHQRLADWLEQPGLQRILIALILINAVVLGLETSRSIAGRMGPWLIAIDRTILVIFVVEIALRLVAHRLAFFRDPGASSTSSSWRLRSFRPRVPGGAPGAACPARPSADHPGPEHEACRRRIARRAARPRLGRGDHRAHLLCCRRHRHQALLPRTTRSGSAASERAPSRFSR